MAGAPNRARQCFIFKNLKKTQVVCCASNLHARRLQEFEQLKGEFETLKNSAGEFRDTAARKRPREPENSSGPKDIWQEFEESIKGHTLEPAF